MSFFQPQTIRSIQDFVNRTVKTWDSASKADKASGQLIDPDEPIVLRVPNPDWEEGEEGPYGDADDGEPTHLCYHVESHGGGGDTDEDGNECGHDGGSFTGMEMDARKFLANGRRWKK